METLGCNWENPRALLLAELEQTDGINGEQYACMGENVSTSTFAVLDSAGDCDLYAAKVEGVRRVSDGYRRVVGDY